MKRHLVFALATLLVLPRLGQAQNDQDWGPKFRVTPWVGVSPGINQNGIATVFANGATTAHEYRLEMSSSVPVGVNVDYRFWKRFAVVGGGMWSSRGDDRLIDFEDELIYRTTGSNLWMAKLGGAVHLREEQDEMQLRHLNASVFIAPAFIHDAPKDNLAIPSISQTSVNSWGLNIGAEGELPLSDTRFAFQVGLEDWIMWWDEAKYSARVQAYLQQGVANLSAVALEAEKTHLWVGRIGLSYRF